MKLVRIFAVSQSLTPTAMLEYLLYAVIIALAALAGYRRSIREEHDGTAERRRRRKEQRRKYDRLWSQACRHYPGIGRYNERRSYIESHWNDPGS